MAFPSLPRLTLRMKLTLLISALFIIPLTIENMNIRRVVHREYYTAYGQRAMDIARYVAEDPEVIAEYQRGARELTPRLGNYLDMLAQAGEAAFIVLMDMDAVRLYHPKRDRIGKKFVGGDEGRALKGETYISSSRGTLGFSQRAFIPVRDEEGNQLGAVSVGMLSDSIESLIQRISQPMQQMLIAALLVGLVATAFISGRIRDILFGLEPEDVAKIMEEHKAILSIVNEGIIAVDTNGIVTLVNDEALRILHKAGIEDSLLGKPLNSVMPETPLMQVLKTGHAEHDHEMTLNNVPVLASHIPLLINGASVGAIATFKDLSDMRKLAAEIMDVHRYAGALRSQSHEFMNKLHAILGLVNTGSLEEIKNYVGGLIDVKDAQTGHITDHIHEPVLAGFLASKYSAAYERGVSIFFDFDGELPALGNTKAVHGLVTILGNLIDNALDAVHSTRTKKITVSIGVAARVLDILVADTGEGMIEGNLPKIFTKGYSTRGPGRGTGLWLVVKTVDELNGTITVDTTPGGGTTIDISLPAEEVLRSG